MKISLNILKKFVDIKLASEALADLLTERAFEVESLNVIEEKFSGIKAAKVVKIETHPNADKLRLIALYDGSRTIFPVVCAAMNFETDDIVALALPGSRLPQSKSPDNTPLILEKVSIRGIESQGMICAAEELGLGAATGGKEVLVLDRSVRPGTDLKTLYPPDVIFEIAIPANRPDLFSHNGVAREIAAVTGSRYKKPDYAEPKGRPVQDKVAVKSKTLCRAFHSATMTVSVGPSPLWLQRHLLNLGMRPINNVVDITNYVMVEMGEPTHAFDADKINGRMTVRPANKGEKVETIDHALRELDPTILVIADEVKPLDVAGVMGGLESEITEATRRIVLTAANFEPTSVRKTAHKLGLHSPASNYFSKGLHPALAKEGLLRGIELLTEHAGAKLEKIYSYSTVINKPSRITFNKDNINLLLGTQLSSLDMKKYLKRYNINVSGTGQLTATPPDYRTDLHASPDLAEEILKAHGLNSPKALPFFVSTASALAQNSFSSQIRIIKEFWSILGYNEVQNYNFVSAADIENFGAKPTDHVAIANPLSKDQAYLKKHLLIPLLKNVAANQKEFSRLQLFEVGKKYLGYTKEPLWLYGLIFDRGRQPQQTLNLLKGDIEHFFRHQGIKDLSFKSDSAYWSEIFAGRQSVGYVGMIEPRIQQNFDIDHEVLFVELSLEQLYDKSLGPVYASQSKYPAVVRDLSLIVPKSAAWKDVSAAVNSVSNLITHVDLFEAPFLASKDTQKFHEDLVAKGQKNLGIRLTFQAPDRTLTDEEITGIYDKIVLKLKQELIVQIH